MSTTVSMPANTISFEKVQQATARCLQVYPAVDAVLPKECFLLAELMGRMIYARNEGVDAATLSAATLEDFRRWSTPLTLRAAA